MRDRPGGSGHLHPGLACGGTLLAALAAWLQGRGLTGLVAGLMLGLVIPFTLLVILPPDKRLLDPGLDRGSVETAALLARGAGFTRLGASRAGSPSD